MTGSRDRVDLPEPWRSASDPKPPVCRSTDPAAARRWSTGGPPTSCPATRTPIPRCPACWPPRRRPVPSSTATPTWPHTALTAALAERLGVAPERLAFGTGSVAVLFHLLNVLGRPGAEVVYAFRSFEAYPIATQLSGATGVPVPLTAAYEHDLDAMLAAVDRPPWPCCSARRTTRPGRRCARSTSRRSWTRCPMTSPWCWTRRTWSSSTTRPRSPGSSLVDRPNVVVLRTFSKAYGLAGLRIGYCVAPAELAAACPRGGEPLRRHHDRPGRGARVAGGRAGPARAGGRARASAGRRC